MPPQKGLRTTWEHGRDCMAMTTVPSGPPSRHSRSVNPWTAIAVHSPAIRPSDRWGATITPASSPSWKTPLLTVLLVMAAMSFPFSSAFAAIEDVLYKSGKITKEEWQQVKDEKKKEAATHNPSYAGGGHLHGIPGVSTRGQPSQSTRLPFVPQIAGARPSHLRRPRHGRPPC